MSLSLLVREKSPLDFAKLDSYMHQFKGSTSRYRSLSLSLQIILGWMLKIIVFVLFMQHWSKEGENRVYTVQGILQSWKW